MRYVNYKPTGVRKFPSIPVEWEVRRVKNFAVISHGADPKTEGDIPVYGSGDSAFKSCGEFKVGPVVLIGRKGATLHIPHYVDGKYWNVDTAFDVRVVSGNDLKWFYYLAQCFDYSLYVSRTTLPSMTQSNYYNMSVPYPPLPTQRAIVAFLDEKCGKIDRWVAAKEREVALLKELKQSMIAEAVTGATKVARTDTARKMKPSGIPWLPEVPEGWEVKKVRQHFRLRSEKVSEQDYPPLSVAKVGVVPQLADVAISMAQGETRKLVREGDYVVNSRSDRKGSCGIAPQDGSVTTISIVLEPRQIDRQFVHYLFRSTPWVEEFYRNGRGIVADLWTTRYQEMRNMVFPLPPLAEQRAIVAYIEARAAKIDAAVAGVEREVAAMKEYKQRLIADVVTGQRKVA